MQNALLRQRLDRVSGLCLGVLLAILFLAGLGQARAAEESGTLILVVTGLGSERGEVLIQLASSPADWDDDATGFRAVRVKPSGARLEQRFEAIPYGDYALKVFHDENANEELDIGWTGPEERYGFSNGARGTFGPPDWDDAKFRLDAPEKTVTVEVR